LPGILRPAPTTLEWHYKDTTFFWFLQILACDLPANLHEIQRFFAGPLFPLSRRVVSAERKAEASVARGGDSLLFYV
jgi:hypothetical protein